MYKRPIILRETVANVLRAQNKKKGLRTTASEIEARFVELNEMIEARARSFMAGPGEPSPQMWEIAYEEVLEFGINAPMRKKEPSLITPLAAEQLELIFSGGRLTDEEIAQKDAELQAQYGVEADAHIDWYGDGALADVLSDDGVDGNGGNEDDEDEDDDTDGGYYKPRDERASLDFYYDLLDWVIDAFVDEIDDRGVLEEATNSLWVKIIEDPSRDPRYSYRSWHPEDEGVL